MRLTQRWSMRRGRPLAAPAGQEAAPGRQRRRRQVGRAVPRCPACVRGMDQGHGPATALRRRRRSRTHRRGYGRRDRSCSRTRPRVRGTISLATLRTSPAAGPVPVRRGPLIPPSCLRPCADSVCRPCRTFARRSRRPVGRLWRLWRLWLPGLWWRRRRRVRSVRGVLWPRGVGGARRQQRRGRHHADVPRGRQGHAQGGQLLRQRQVQAVQWHRRQAGHHPQEVPAVRGHWPGAPGCRPSAATRPGQRDANTRSS